MKRSITADDRDTLSIATAIEAVLLFAAVGALLVWWFS